MSSKTKQTERKFSWVFERIYGEFGTSGRIAGFDMARFEERKP